MELLKKHPKLFQWFFLLIVFFALCFAIDVPETYKLENPDQMIDFQTEYTKELHGLSDYPKIDFELIRKHFKEWEHHKVEDIMTYRNKSFSSPVTGSVAPIHHTPWASAMDDSSKTFLNQSKK